MAIRLTQYYIDVGGLVTSGKLRVTRQYVDALTKITSGKLRVTRQYVDVLVSIPSGTTYNKSGTSILNFSDIANTEIPETISSTLAFVATVIVTNTEATASANSTLSFVSTGEGKNTTTLVSASDTITFTQTASTFVSDQAASQSLGISDAANIQAVFSVSALSTLTFTHQLNRVTTELASNAIYFIHYSLVAFFEHRNVTEHTISFTDSASTAGFKGVSQDLGITDSVDVRGPVFISALSSLFFTNISLSLNQYRSAYTGIVFACNAQTITIHNVFDTLAITQFAQIEFGLNILTFIDSVDVGKSKAYKATITFVDSAIQSGGTFRRSILNTLGVDHHLTYYEDAACLRKQYTPFSGEGAKVANSIPNPQFITNADQRLLLYYPSRGVRDTTVNIRPPGFGNRDRNAYTRINRETRGGHLIVFADPTWVNKRSIHVTLTGLKRSDIDNIQNLFYTYLGKLIGLTDWEGNEWEGVITDPDQPVTHDSKHNWTVSFTFEGEIIEGYSPGSKIDASTAYTLWKDPGANTDLALDSIVGGAGLEGSKGSPLAFHQTASATVA